MLNAISHDSKMVKKLEDKELENIRDMARRIREATCIQGFELESWQVEDINAELNRRRW